MDASYFSHASLIVLLCNQLVLHGIAKQVLQCIRHRFNARTILKGSITDLLNAKNGYSDIRASLYFSKILS
jgi:hypothetical protein